MKRLMLLLCTMLMCSGCTALPAEERAFAVALCVEKGEAWRVHGRIPTYQTGGGYQTVTGTGNTLSAALSDMDASAPMHVNLSQLRLLAIDARLAETLEMDAVLHVFADRSDMRQQCAVALADVPAKTVAVALKPAAGTRLSKSIDLMLDARIEQGIILPVTLADLMRMGERQCPVLMSLTLEEGMVRLSGGVTLHGGVSISAEETILLSMLLGHTKTPHLTFGDGAADVRDASAKVRLSEDFRTAFVTLTLRTTASSFTADELEQILADKLLALLTRLSGDGADVLGLGRSAILSAHDMAEWNALRWPELYRGIRWSISVRVTGPA